MKKIILGATIALTLTFTGTSCGDYLNIVPEGTPSLDNAFSNRINSFKFLYTCYSYLPSWDQGGSIGFLAGDEHWLIPKGTGFIEQRISLNAWEIGRGEQNSNDPWQNYWDGGNGGTNLWVAIRDCNTFLENIHKPEDIEEYERVRWIAEVKFLKAYYHYYLFSLYGPIPIMDENISIDSSQEEVRRYRDPVDDVVAYIVALLDEAANDLPVTIADELIELGRATQIIAKSVKAQVLLLAASPLFNGNADYASVKDNRDRYIFGSAEPDKNKWQKAADAAMEAIQLAESHGHALYTYHLALSSISDATKRILSIKGAVTEKWNKEILWGSTRNVTGLETVSMAKHTKGNNWNARSVLAPTLSVAETFYSSHGVPISEDNGAFWSENYPKRYSTMTIPDEGDNRYILELGAETAALHLEREPRFYASLAFDRGTWYGKGYTNDEQRNLGLYRFRAREVSGRSTSEDHSFTGYLNKKVCSYECNLTSGSWSPYRYAFPIIRLADLYLMYAEALNEVKDSPDDEVYRYVDLVRERAGLEGVVDSWGKYSINPDKPMTQGGMRQIIRNERLNELAGEGRRFWDLRRWKQDLPSEVRGWNIKGQSAQEFYRVTTLYRRTKYSYKDYLWPLKVSSLLKNPNLVQNPGW